MKPNNKKWMTVTLTVAALAAATTGCKDDHFDVNSDVLGEKTIWQNIQSNPELSQYADILQSVYYSQTEEKTTPETYADLFNGEQTLTVWAPLNGKFDYAYYKGLLSTGNRDSIYKVEKELIRNNMTRYTNILNGTDSVKLDLFNEKAAWLNYAKGTIQGQVISTPNIAASNGVLHITDGAMAYQPNLYEYMAKRQDLDSLNAFIKGFQKTEFNEYASTQGPTVNGQITWVDSITYVANDYTDRYMNAYLNREDSNYVMIMPTNTAWEAILAKTKGLFKFKTEYNQTIHTQTEQGADTSYVSTTTWTQEELDSLVNLYSKNAICQDLAFNANWQYEQIPITSIQDIRNADARKDSLRSTAGTKFKPTGTLNQTNKSNAVEVDNFAEMFGNAEPVETSNGYAYVVNEWKLPSTVYAPVIDRTGITAFEYADNNCIASSATTTSTYTNYPIEIDGTEASIDSVYKYNNLLMTARTNTSHPGAYFKLLGVLSGTYDIFAVICYNMAENKQNKFRAYLGYDTETGRINIEKTPGSSTKNNDAILKNPEADAVDAQGESLTGGNFFVNQGIRYNYKDGKPNAELTDTVCLARDFTFPVSYQGMSNAYPTLFLQSSFSSKEKDYYSRNIRVNAIILRPKEN